MDNNKQCWNCKSELSFHSAQCPFCGVSLAMWNEGETGENNGVLYSAESNLNATPPEPSYNKEPMPQFVEKECNAAILEPKAISQEWAGRTSLLALVFLLPASIFFVFGFMMFFFARDGELILRWNASYWGFYLAAALPLFYLGWRASLQIGMDEKKENLKSKDNLPNVSIDE